MLENTHDHQIHLADHLSLKLLEVLGAHVSDAVWPGHHVLNMACHGRGLFVRLGHDAIGQFLG